MIKNERVSKILIEQNNKDEIRTFKHLEDENLGTHKGNDF